MPLLDDFRQAIALQQAKDNEAYDEQMKLSLEERELKGVTMANLRIEFAFYDEAPNSFCPALNYPEKFIRSVRVITDKNISKFREGEQVELVHGLRKFKMDIVEDSVDEFILAPNDYEVKQCHINSEDYPANNWEINIIQTDLTLRLMTATAGSLQHDQERLAVMEGLLDGRLVNVQTKASVYSKLNESQNGAVVQALGASHFHLIQGPPGTGKTETIAHIAAELISQGLRVFVTAPTHTAINNCLNAVAAIQRDPSRVVKIGADHQAAEIIENRYVSRREKLSHFIYSIVPDFSKNGIVIGGTPYCFCYPASKRLEGWEFDVAIIDEAAQMSIPQAIATMSKSNKFIFVGDHQQLDPIIPSGTGLSMFAESIFSRLARLYPRDRSLLRTSYRLNEGLMRIPNILFYNNELDSAVSGVSASENIVSKEMSEIWENKDPKVLYLHQEFDAQGRSPYEARIVSELVSDLIGHGVDLNSIGIISPYRAQVREIRKALNQRLGWREKKGTTTLFVDTVDRIQGQQRDYIIYSMANSNPLESKRRLDFFYSPNRLNVAITRAMKKCIVIANYKVFDIIDEELKEVPDFDRIKAGLDIFKKYFELSTKVRQGFEEIGW
jgi:DNA replication ATP-dependent helicase Dna2